MRNRPRLAAVLCAIAVAACQATASPLPSTHASTAPSPSALPTISVAPSLAPSAEILDSGGDAIRAAQYGRVIPTPDGFLASGMSTPITAADVRSILAAGSPDGASWSPLASDRVFRGLLEDIAIGPHGWLAAEDVGTSAGAGTLLWHSVDGRSWSRVPEQAGLATSFRLRIVAGEWGFAMLGQATDATGTSGDAVWVSRDGLAWRQMPPLDLGGGQIVALPGGILALGSGRASITTDGVSWVDAGALPGFVSGAAASALGDDVLAIFGELDGSGRLWRGTLGGQPSQPTLQWSDAGLDMTSGASLVAMATGSLGALVLGFERQTLRPISWVSTDARTWRRSELDPSAFGGGVPTIAAVGNRAFVVLGWSGNEGGDVVARAWTSQDGAAWEGTRPDQLGILPGLPSQACPARTPTDVTQLIAMAGSYPTIPQASWPYCFGHRQLVLGAYVRGCGGCGGTTPYVAVPSWLLSALGYGQFWLAGARGSSGDALSVSVQIDPGHPVRVPPPNSHVRVTGHFDDAAATGCRLIPSEAGTELPPAGVEVAHCRQQFVVTAIKVLPD